MHKKLFFYSNFKFMNNNVKIYLLNKCDLFEDDEFVKKIFLSYCTKSNLEMAKFICEYNNIIDRCLHDPVYNVNLFVKICKKSNLEMVCWFYSKFKNNINLNNMHIILLSIQNSNIEIFDYILDMTKNNI